MLTHLAIGSGIGTVTSDFTPEQPQDPTTLSQLPRWPITRRERRHQPVENIREARRGGESASSRSEPDRTTNPSDLSHSCA